LFGDQDDNDQQNERPGDAMSNHLQRGNIMQQFPVYREKPPHYIRGETVPNAFIHKSPLDVNSREMS
jgi:hypothetical protein